MRLTIATAFVLSFLGLCSACGDEDETTTTEGQPTDTVTEGERPEREGPEGCYIPSQMLCDCDVVEVDCTEDVGVWTPGCMSCQT
jgi:hypothetical protein